MESSALASVSIPEYVQFDGDLLPVVWLEGEVLAEFLAFLDDAAATAEDEAEPYEVEFEEEEEEPQEVEFAADDRSDDDDVCGDLLDDGGIMEDGVDYVYNDVELVDADFEDGSFDDLVSDADLADDDGGATTPAAEELTARVAEPPAATAGYANARMSVKPVNQFGEDYEAINEMIRVYLQAEKKRRRARRVAAAMLRLQRQRLLPAAERDVVGRRCQDGGAPTYGRRHARSI